MVARVLVELKLQNTDKTFFYKIPSHLSIEVGMRVLVPFGKQELEGFVLEILEDKKDLELKNILKAVDDHAILNEELLKIGEYISKKTLCSLIQAYQTMLPSALKAKNNFMIPKKYVSYISLNMDY